MTLPARQAEPGQRFRLNGVAVEADERGVLQPTTRAEADLADRFGLPVIAAPDPAPADPIEPPDSPAQED